MPFWRRSWAMSTAARLGLGTHRWRRSRVAKSARAWSTVDLVLPEVRSSALLTAPARRPYQLGSAKGWVRRISEGRVAVRGLAAQLRTSLRVSPARAAAWK